MDRAISASEANQRFSALLRAVRGGQSFVVTARGQPVARVVPIEEGAGQGAGMADLLAFAAAQPRRRLAGWRRDDLHGPSGGDGGA